MSRAVELPADLFARLAALDGRCDFTFVRAGRYPAGTQWSAVRDHHGIVRASVPDRQEARVWTVTITVTGGLPHERIQIFRPALADALGEAIAQAEALGWHLDRVRSA